MEAEIPSKVSLEIQLLSNTISINPSVVQESESISALFTALPENVLVYASVFGSQNSSLLRYHRVLDYTEITLHDLKNMGKPYRRVEYHLDSRFAKEWNGTDPWPVQGENPEK